MKDNKTAHSANEYDKKIESTIPYYSEFHESIFDIINTHNPNVKTWLDTGAGTGNLIHKAKNIFTETKFYLADPSEAMLKKAKMKMKDMEQIDFYLSDTQSLTFDSNQFDVITAIQCHHYLHEDQRKIAVENCFRMLKSGGIYIFFENIKPATEIGEKLALQRWFTYQQKHGKSEIEINTHLNRYNVEFFPITLDEHNKLLQNTGFNVVEALWTSYMQGGFYAIKF